MIRSIFKFKWTAVYIATIPAVNYAFVHTPFIDLPDGGNFTPLSIIVGLILVLRDFVQREIGHFVFIPLIIGAILSYALAGPEIALASGLAFFISEVIDWAIYTFTKRPLSARIMLSSMVAAPIDTIVFMIGVSMTVDNFMQVSTLVAMIVSKLFGAYVVYLLVKRREKRPLETRIGNETLRPKNQRTI